MQCFYQVRYNSAKHRYQQGSICIPSAVYEEAGFVSRGVASAFEFYNGENLLLPAFEYDPHTNLSTVISFSIDNNASKVELTMTMTVISFSIDNNASKVELAEDSEPIRITFKQVFFSDRYIYCLSPAFPSAKCKLWFLGHGRAHLVFWRVSTELRAQHQRGDGVETVSICFHCFLRCATVSTSQASTSSWIGQDSALDCPQCPPLIFCQRFGFSYPIHVLL